MPALSAAELHWELAELALNSIHWCDRLLSTDPVYWHHVEDKEGAQ